MAKYDTIPNFVELEKGVLKHWEDCNCFDKLKEKNKGGKVFRFLDGPITANNQMGVHHAWGRSLKDIYIRYHAMHGHSCHYRNGFDSQGLWVEVEVEKELGFKDKRDILEYGLDNFTNKCKERIQRFSGVITEQSKRLGQMMDWDNSYFTHTDENIQGIWHFLKKCHDMGMIDKAYRPMPWCPRCGTSLSEHEMSGSYKELTHTSVFAKLPIDGKDFDILVWTTTPWTLTANVALAVNPENDYCIVQTDIFDKPICVGKEVIKILQCKKTILDTIKGSDLVGLTYETFFPDLKAQQGIEHKILPWSDVAATDGSGTVHIAPGCGAEDFELGKTHGIAAICPVDESGRFTAEYGFLAGMGAKEAAQHIFDYLTKNGKMYRTEEFTHSYPVCWRCKTEVLFRLVREWYIKTEGIKPRLKAAADTVKWTPAYIGKRMHDWLDNMGDWNISRKRFYGLPLPIYPCDNCGKLTVVGSREELLSLSDGIYNPPELHRPWIDEVKIKCECGCEVARIPEVGDVWLDAGIVPYSTMGYFSDKEAWKKYFPAEWVSEMREQVRLWFYSMLFMSVVLEDRAPYEHVMAYNAVVAEDGSKFSKTGNSLKFNEVADIIGADTIRYLFAGASISNDVRFGYTLGDEAKRKMLGLWNSYVFFMTYADLEQPDVTSPVDEKLLDITDKWLNARLQQYIASCDAAYAAYNTPEVVAQFEAMIDDLSNWYIRVNRRRFWKEGTSDDKRAAYVSLYNAIKTITVVMAPIMPFMCDYVWQQMVRKYEQSAPESIHLVDFPKVQAIDSGIIENASYVREIVTLALKLRNEQQLKVRQPLQNMQLAPIGDSNALKQAIAEYNDIIKDELNIKAIEVIDNAGELYDKFLTLNFREAGRVLKGDANAVKQLLAEMPADQMKQAVAAFESGADVQVGAHALTPSLLTLSTKCKENICVTQSDRVTIALDTTITPELEQEGLFREVLRQCQVLRKEAGLNVEDRIHLTVTTDNALLKQVLEIFGDKLMQETLAKSLNSHNGESTLKQLELDDVTCTIGVAKA